MENSVTLFAEVHRPDGAPGGGYLFMRCVPQRTEVPPPVTPTFVPFLYPVPLGADLSVVGMVEVFDRVRELCVQDHAGMGLRLLCAPTVFREEHCERLAGDDGALQSLRRAVLTRGLLVTTSVLPDVPMRVRAWSMRLEGGSAVVRYAVAWSDGQQAVIESSGQGSVLHRDGQRFPCSYRPIFERSA